MSHLSSLLLCCALAAAAVAVAQDEPVPAPPAIDRARFDELQRVLRPDPAAPWRTIPWRIDLLAAQREAVAADKPLFVWAMDGHPLGCT